MGATAAVQQKNMMAAMVVGSNYNGTTTTVAQQALAPHGLVQLFFQRWNWAGCVESTSFSLTNTEIDFADGSTKSISAPTMICSSQIDAHASESSSPVNYLEINCANPAAVPAPAAIAVNNYEPSCNNFENQTAPLIDRHVDDDLLDIEKDHYRCNLSSLFSLVDKNQDGNVTEDDIKSFLHTKLGMDFNCLNHVPPHHSCSSDTKTAAVGFTPGNINSDDSQSKENSVDFEGFVRLYESITVDQRGDGAAHHQELFYKSDTEKWSVVGSAGNDRDDRIVDEDMEEAFGVYDKNGDGVISAGELAIVLRRLGLMPRRAAEMGDHEWEEERSYCQTLIDRFDRNGDGVIDLGEFCALFMESV